MALLVVLVDDPNGDFCLRQQLVAKLASLGVTSIGLVRDAETVGVVLEGWLFDAGRSGCAAAEALGAASSGRTLHPILQLAVSAIDEGGRHARAIA